MILIHSKYAVQIMGFIFVLWNFWLVVFFQPVSNEVQLSEGRMSVS